MNYAYIVRVVRVLIFQPRATVTKFGRTVELVILKTSGNAAIKIYHSLYLFRHKNVLCTKEAFSEPQYGGKCPLGDVKSYSSRLFPPCVTQKI